MKIVSLIFLILLCIGGYVVFTHYRAEKQETNGEVHWADGEPTADQKARFAKENSGDTPDGNSEHKDRTASQEAITTNQNTAAMNGEVSASIPARQSTANTATPVDTTRAVTPVQPAAPAPPPATGGYTVSSGTSSGPLPVSDTQSANATNNLHFGGGGHYEWYRQGNITYRVDPATGGTCVAFATLEEWRKQIVYSHGCGRGV